MWWGKTKTPGNTVSLYLCSSLFHRVSRGLGNVAIDQNATRPDTRGGGLPGTRRMRTRATHLPACSFADTVHRCVLLRFTLPLFTPFFYSNPLCFLSIYSIGDRIHSSLSRSRCFNSERVTQGPSRNCSRVRFAYFSATRNFILSYFRPLFSPLRDTDSYKVS